ncbi:uncharacterized protein LOC131217403 [Magnolia sinica]|uniref:uncharacterized protein LOC131217403 n=1 Tax=Magnolia sinica TaxID=86752 RepID=UPI00265A5882|nr:uncharacterized protein LOC131217403 [Magnolia sinica]
MERAYDRVECQFLRQVLLKFGFGPSWVKMVEFCWKDNWLSVLVNEVSCGFFNSSRGLRQGDPLSPRLFILASKVFSRGLSRLSSSGVCTPFKVKSDCKQISHLLYADDTVLFLNGSSKSIQHILGIDKAASNFSYLSVPIFKGQSKSSYFAPLLGKMAAKIQGWSARILSQAGGLALISFVLAGIPIHTLAAMILPKKKSERVGKDVC